MDHIKKNEKVKKHTKSLTSSADLIYKIFEKGDNELSIQFLRWKLWKRWPEYAGETIGKISEPVSYYQGKLYIYVHNSSWMQQMVFIKDNLRGNINTKLGFEYIKQIVLTMDPKDIPQNTEVVQNLISNIEKISKEE